MPNDTPKSRKVVRVWGQSATPEHVARCERVVLLAQHAGGAGVVIREGDTIRATAVFPVSPVDRPAA